MHPAVSPRTTRRILLWTMALSMVVRMLYLADNGDSAFFAVPLLDGKYYDTTAHHLLTGRNLAALDPSFRPLLYPAFLATAYAVGGSLGPALAIGLQHLLGVLTTALVAWYALRLFRRPAAGALAGGLYALAGPPLFFEGELLITTVFNLLLFAVLVAVDPAEEPRVRSWALAGLLLALAAQARANALLYFAFFPLFALLGPGSWTRRRGALAAALVAGSLGLGLAAVAHAPFRGSLQLLPSAGGVNFYLGNHQGADGRIPRQGGAVTYGDEYRDSVQVWSAAVYRDTMGEVGSPSQVSRFWWGRSLEEITDAPDAWLRLMGQKVFFLLGDREIANNKSYEFVREEESWLLPLLPVRWAWLLALAPLGAMLAYQVGERRRLLALLLFLALGAAGIVLFFVNSRFRLPLWPLLTVLGAGGLLHLADAFSQRDWAVMARRGAVAVVVALFALVDWAGPQPGGFARDHFFRSLARLEQGNTEGALADARQSVMLEPTDPAAWCQLGNAALALGDETEAFESYRRAAELAPREPRVFNNMALLHERASRPWDAYRGYRYALVLAPDFAPALVNTALLELRAGLIADAASRIEAASATGFEGVTLDAAQAFLASAQGRPDDANRHWARAQARDPEGAARLLADNRLRISPESLWAGMPPPDEAMQ